MCCLGVHILTWLGKYALFLCLIHHTDIYTRFVKMESRRQVSAFLDSHTIEISAVEKGDFKILSSTLLLSAPLSSSLLPYALWKLTLIDRKTDRYT